MTEVQDNFNNNPKDYIENSYKRNYFESENPEERIEILSKIVDKAPKLHIEVNII